MISDKKIEKCRTAFDANNDKNALESQLIHGLKSKCSFCLEDVKFNCSQCKKIGYCCKEHQKNDWPNHRRVCKPPESNDLNKGLTDNLNLINSPERAIDETTSTSNTIARDSSMTTSATKSGNPISDTSLNIGASSEVIPWSSGLSQNQQYEWLIDCFRLHLYDKYKDKSSLQNLLLNDLFVYKEAYTEFILFCILAHQHNIISTANWIWNKFLSLFLLSLHFEFSENEAKNKYGNDCIILLFPIPLNMRSLRYIAHIIYNGDETTSISSKIPYIKLKKLIHIQYLQIMRSKTIREVDAAMSNLLISYSLFDNIGGIDIWGSTYMALRTKTSRLAVIEGIKAGATAPMFFFGDNPISDSLLQQLANEIILKTSLKDPISTSKLAQSASTSTSTSNTNTTSNVTIPNTSNSITTNTMSSTITSGTVNTNNKKEIPIPIQKSLKSLDKNKSFEKWTLGRTLNQQYEWLVDCFRLRLREQINYKPSALQSTHCLLGLVLPEFLLFSQLANEREFIPDTWDWSHFIIVLNLHIRNDFTIHVATKKYEVQQVHQNTSSSSSSSSSSNSYSNRNKNSNQEDEELIRIRGGGGIELLRNIANGIYGHTIKDYKTHNNLSNLFKLYISRIYRNNSKLFELLRSHEMDNILNYIIQFFNNEDLFNGIGSCSVWRSLFMYLIMDSPMNFNDTNISISLEDLFEFHKNISVTNPDMIFPKDITPNELSKTWKLVNNGHNNNNSNRKSSSSNKKKENVVLSNRKKQKKTSDNSTSTSTSITATRLNKTAISDKTAITVSGSAPQGDKGQEDKGTGNEYGHGHGHEHGIQKSSSIGVDCTTTATTTATGIDTLHIGSISELDGSMNKTIITAAAAAAAAAAAESNNKNNSDNNDQNGINESCKDNSASDDDDDNDNDDDDDDDWALPPLTPLVVVPPLTWTEGLTADEQYEWLTDCFRLRYNDVRKDVQLQQRLNVTRFRGEELMPEFLLFCKLAVLRNAIPQKQEHCSWDWDWSKFLLIASMNIRNEFKECHAIEKYGSEDIQAVMNGGKSLRYTANTIYECSIGDKISPSSSLQISIGNNIRNKKFRAIFNKAKTSEKKLKKTIEIYFQDEILFEEVGGGFVWNRFFIHLREDCVPFVVTDSCNMSLSECLSANLESFYVQSSIEKYTERKDHETDQVIISATASDSSTTSGNASDTPMKNQHQDQHPDPYQSQSQSQITSQGDGELHNSTVVVVAGEGDSSMNMLNDNDLSLIRGICTRTSIITAATTASDIATTASLTNCTIHMQPEVMESSINKTQTKTALPMEEVGVTTYPCPDPCPPPLPVCTSISSSSSSCDTNITSNRSKSKKKRNPKPDTSTSTITQRIVDTVVVTQQQQSQQLQQLITPPPPPGLSKITTTDTEIQISQNNIVIQPSPPPPTTTTTIPLPATILPSPLLSQPSDVVNVEVKGKTSETETQSQIQSQSHVQSQAAVLISPSFCNTGLPTTLQYNWIIDCFRLRFYDSHIYRKAQREHKKNINNVKTPFSVLECIYPEFLIFCKFAQNKHVIPLHWDWELMLEIAAMIIKTDFKSIHAQEKYESSEFFGIYKEHSNISLKIIANIVYTDSVRDNIDLDPLYLMINALKNPSEIQKLDAINTFFHFHNDLFEDVGGNVLWWRFLALLGQSRKFTNPILIYTLKALDGIKSVDCNDSLSL